MRKLTAVLALTAMPGLTFAQPAEIVENGSFERWEDGLPVGWRCNVDTPSAETGDAPDGARWLRVTRPEGASHALVYQRHEVKPDTGYRLRARIRAPRPSYYSLIAYNAVMNTLAAKSTGWAAMEDWLELELDFRTGEEDRVMSVGLLAFGPEAHWDDVRMWEDDSVRIGDLTPTINDAAQPDADDRERGYIVFGRPAGNFVSPAFIPADQPPPGGTCAPGQYQTIAVGVHALENLRGVRASVGAASPADVELLQVAPSRHAITSQSWERYPLLLVPPHATDLSAGETLQYAVRVRVPEGARQFEAPVLTIEPEGREQQRVPVAVEVPDVSLDPADITYFMYYSDSYLPPEAATAPMQAAYYRDMAAHGMNSVSLYVIPEHEGTGVYGVDLHRDWRYAPGDMRHSLGMAERIAQMRAAGLASSDRPLVLISGGAGKYGWGAFRDPHTVPALIARGRDLGWPPLLFYVHDEPNNEERAEAVRHTFERVYSITPEARTVTAIADYGLEEVGHLYDVWIAALSAIDDDLLERARREGKELWAYDCRHRGQRPEFDRFVCGVWAWNAGIRGLGQWAYYGRKMLQRNEDGGWDAPQDFDEWYMMPSETGPIATVGWEARREGIEDYRALATLARLVQEHGIGPDTSASEGGGAWQVLRDARQFAPVDGFAAAPRDFRYVWEYEPWHLNGGGGAGAWETMAQLRERALLEIERLQAAD